MKKLTSFILRFLDKTGPFYFILSSIFALSGDMDSTVTWLLLISCFFGVVMTLMDRKKTIN